ncbi:MAG: hypothetical protein ACK41T_01925 [Pseudobdellovibrio sp.]
MIKLIKNNNFEISKNKMSEVKQVCLTSQNTTSSLKLCKDVLVKTQGPLRAYIDGVQTSLLGRVIMNQPNKNIQLQIKNSELNYLEMVTKKRKIMPGEVTKLVGKRSWEIELYDLDNDNKNWTEIVGFDQDSIKIPTDPLLLVYQDYFNKDFSDKKVNFVYYTKVYQRPEIKNLNRFAPVLGYSKLTGNTLRQNAAILSEMDYGFKVSTTREIKKDSDKYLTFFNFWDISANVRSIKYVPSVNNYSISGAQVLSYGLEGHLIKSYNSKFSYSFFSLLQKDTVFEKASTANRISLTGVLNADLGASALYKFYDKGRIFGTVQPMYSVILPTKISGVSSSIGQRLGLKLDVNYSDKDKLYGLGVSYSTRNQKTSEQKFTSQTFDYVFSYSYLF